MRQTVEYRDGSMLREHHAQRGQMVAVRGEWYRV